ncbi:hypothetical protein Sru01_35900 [Sphaerisporangium rufum]|uniref:CU044_5270 family protein n=1 Tax=Sphaerisporangium rufum TaxID=1381558 RepID=A0A919R3X1_9ACTN|nr:CU044_5270 family protein [Sphaerisporangium rufum]GII78608.1 hypothetical protein Sru01_35900 [Sphaerisporangium rufum]
MNELELVGRLRDEVPQRPDVRAEEQRLLAVIRGGAPSGRLAAVRPARSVRHLGWGLALAGAGLAAGTVAVLQAGGTGEPGNRPAVAGPQAARPRGAAVVLEKAALIAASTQVPAIRPDQWVYQKETQHFPDGDLPTFEHWSRVDGKQDAIREEGRELKVGKAEQGPMNPAKTQRDIDALPTDPDDLLAHFRGEAGADAWKAVCGLECPPGTEADAKAFGKIGWYLKYAPIIPPEKTAAMYRALAKIPRVAIEENTMDGDGRRGIGVVLDLGTSEKTYYILDSGDYHYLGMKAVSGDGTIAMSVLNSGVVDKPGQVP